jgi:tetratricopeptide (TPR) repeat protein
VIRQVAEDGLLPHRRRAVHRAVAEALESLEPPPREQVAARLAHHYAVADVPDRAMACLGQVADRALRAYASGEAVRALEAALGEAERLPAASRERGVLETSLRLAFAQASARQYGAIRDRLVPLRPRFERLGDPVLLGLYHARLAVAHSVLWAHEEADHAARQALAAATRSGDANVLGLAHYVLAVEALRSGRPLDGTTEGRRAVAFLARADEDHMQGLAWWVLGLNHHVLGEFERALEAHAEARHLGERTHDHGLRAAAEVGAAWVHLTRGDLERAAEAARASLAHSPDGFHRASANGVLAAVALEGGAGAPALAALEQAVRQVSRLTMRELILMTLLAEGQLRLGRVAEARETGERLLRLAEETRLAWGTAGAWRVLGNVARATGDAAASAARLTRALELFEAVPAPFEVARTRLDLAALALAGGGDPRARDWLVEAERVFRAAGAPAHAARAARLQARGPTGAPPAPDAR